MAGEGEFPKVDGDILFDGDINNIYYSVAPDTASSVFGGDGGDGAFTSSGTDNLTPGRVYQYTSFTLSGGHTLSSTGASTNPIIVKVSGDCTIAGTIDLAGFGAQGPADGSGGAPGSSGSGVGDILNAATGGGDDGLTGSGGGGGASAIESGADGQGASGGTGGTHGLARYTNVFVACVGGSGAAGGNGSGGSNGGGGDGGGCIIFEVAGDLTISGTIDVSGTAGGEGGASGEGSGGGGGGGIFYATHGGDVTLSSPTWTVSGGAGGTTGNDGGAGGTGGYFIHKVLVR